MTASLQRIRVALHKPANASALVVKARFVVGRMTNNPWFPQPVPPLAKVLAAAQALDEAQTKSQSGAKGLADARNAKRRVLDNLLDRLRAYVEGVANDDPEQGPAIVESAGMDLVTRSHPQRPAFGATWGDVSGTVKLRVKAGPKGSRYEWQMSTDAGETWIDLPSTMQARTLVAGLEPGKTYWFRHRILTRKGQGDWSGAISLLVR
jgi:hypothetical protein